jgi:hypothetical protein
MEEVLSDDSNDSNDEISGGSELDETDNEPVIVRPHKHNLRIKNKKINYNESSRKTPNILESNTVTFSQKPVSSDEIVKRVLKKIVTSLDYYWQKPDQIALISTILDPRYKDLSFLSDNQLKRKTEITLQRKYNELKFQLNPDNELLELSSIKKQSFTTNEDTIFNTLFGIENRQNKRKVNEVDNYLNENITEKAEPNTNPFKWWNENKQRFPVLAILAYKYLSIPATSVPSERLFSDAGNNITSKRTKLKPKFFQEILFVKRNSKYIDIFTLLGNEVNFFNYFEALFLNKILIFFIKYRKILKIYIFNF